MPELRGLQNDLLEVLELNDHWVDLEDLAELHKFDCRYGMPSILAEKLKHYSKEIIRVSKHTL